MLKEIVSDSRTVVGVAAPKDGEAVAAIYGPVVRDTSISFETEPPTGSEMAGLIRSTLASSPFSLQSVGAALGYAYASKHRERAGYRWSVDVTVYVAPQAHRTGVGRTLYGPLLSILRAQGFHSAFAGSRCRMQAVSDYMKPWASFLSASTGMSVSSTASGIR